MKKLIVILAIVLLSAVGRADEIGFNTVLDYSPYPSYGMSITKDFAEFGYFSYENTIGRNADTTGHLDTYVSTGLKVWVFNLGVVGGGRLQASEAVPQMSSNGTTITSTPQTNNSFLFGGGEVGITIPVYIGIEKPDDAHFYIKENTRVITDPTVGINTQADISFGVRF